MTLRPLLRRFSRTEDGTTLVELAIVLPVFLLLFIGTIEFGRLGQEYVFAEKALQLAARTAVVRPAACAGVPQINTRGVTPVGTTPPRFGTRCNASATTCANPGTFTCTASLANPTAAEIWAAVSPILPTHATPANMRFTYTYTNQLGFLGGPYTPMVTVELQNLNFQFATPLGGLAALASGNPGSGPGATIAFPSMSMSLPAEDLNLGTNG
jgi:Flp pilus assembly protein TadG